MLFHEVNRKTWFVAYALVWLVLFAASVGDAPWWVRSSLSGVILAGTLATTPAPRNAPSRTPLRPSSHCDCARCDALRARHTRRSTDVKNTD